VIINENLDPFWGEMNSRTEMSNKQWKNFYQLLLLQRRVYVGRIETYPYFLNAVLLGSVFLERIVGGIF
jgi:hypothetical protein